MWRTRPVFVSSTFQDMQAERDHLRTYVFPELEERLRAVRVRLEWVDLRLGIATASLPSESAREQQVLKVCLSEARRCRPFVIVLLGDRYGWVPPDERVTPAAAEEGLVGDIAGSSVTDLEIRVGVLAPKSAPHRCFIYLRDSLPYDKMPADVATFYADACDPQPAGQERAARLTTMKQRLEAALPDRMRRYQADWDAERARVTRLEPWGRVVLEDLWHELSQDATTDAPALSPAEAERNAVEDFALDRARDFVGRERLLNYLIRIATASERGAAHGVCVTGEPGAGKSAIVGELMRRLRGTDTFVLAHATDASPRSSSVDAMLTRFVGELAGALGVDPVPKTEGADALDARFASLLRTLAARKRVVVIVDGLEQFEQTPRGRFLPWLPKPWPPNMVLFATAAPGDASRSLAERPGIEMAALPPLDAGEARHIAKEICARYHRALEPDVLHALVGRTSPAGLACSHPLWLAMAVEELNLLDADDFQRIGRSRSGTPAERLQSLMLDIVSSLPPTADALYGVIFDRADELFGSRCALAFLGLIGSSRGGWREADFRAVLPRLADEPWDGLRFAALRRVFRGQLRQHGVLGQWDVNHSQMRAAALSRVTAAWGDVVRVHTAIVDHLVALEADDPLRVSETAWHLLAIDDWRRTASYYGDPSLTDAAIESAIRTLADHMLRKSATEPAAPESIVELLLDHAGDAREHVAKRLLYYLTDALEGHVRLATQIAVLGRVEAVVRASLAARPGKVMSLVDLSVAQNKLGRLQQAAGRAAEALTMYSAAAGTFRALAENDRENRLWQQGVSMTLRNMGDLLFANGRLEDALSAYGTSAEIARRLAQAAPSDREGQMTLASGLEGVGRTLMARGERTVALNMYRESAAILTNVVKADPDNIEARHALVGSLHGVGEALVAAGRRQEALSTYRSSLTAAEAVSAVNPEDVRGRQAIAVSQERIGEILFNAGDAPGARAAWEQSLAIREKLAASDSANMEWQRDLANSMERIGDTHHFVGQIPEAIEHYARSIEILEGLVSHDADNREWRRGVALTLQKSADALAASAQREKALGAFTKSLGICRTLVSEDAGDVRVLRQLSACAVAAGDVLDDLGRPDEALASYRESLAIRDGLAAADPGNATSRNDLAVVHNRLGNLLAAEGRDEEALSAYRRSLDILAALADADTDNPMHQFNMAIAHERIGRILAADRVEEARDEYRQRVAIAERLIDGEPGRSDWRDLLLRSYETLRDLLAANAGRGNEWRHELMCRHGQIGELHAGAGRLTRALTAYREQLAVAQTLVADAPDDPARQRDLSVAYSAIGDVLMALGQVEDALAAFQQDFAIARRLADADPADADRQWDLSTSYNRIGDAMLAQQRVDEAEAAFRSGLAIRSRIAPAQEENLGWQRGLGVSYNKLATVLIATDREEEALECRRQMNAISTRLGAHAQ